MNAALKCLSALLALAALPAAAAPIYKCMTSDGRTVFSNAGCGTTPGTAELPDIKINKVGSLIDESSALPHRKPNAPRLTVVKDSSIYDKHDSSSRIRQRLDRREEMLDQARERKNEASGVTVIGDHSRTDFESNHEKAMRLKAEANELRY